MTIGVPSRRAMSRAEPTSSSELHSSMKWLIRLCAPPAPNSAIEWWRGLQCRKTPHGVSGRADHVGDLEAEQVRVEREACFQVGLMDDQVAEAHVPGLETADPRDG